MDNLDIENIRLLKEATNSLLRLSCEELAERMTFPADKDKKPSSRPFSVFGKAAPIHTLQGACSLVEDLLRVKTGGSPSGSPMIALSNEDSELVKTLAEHARRRHLERSRLQPLPAPEDRL